MSDIFLKLAKKYSNPLKVQKLLYSLEYNKKETMRSASTAYKLKSAHCMEGAFLAAAICEQLGFPPLALSMESQDGLDHVLFVYKTKKGWGSVAKSRDIGLNGRLPIFRSIRDLVWSYYAPYIDLTGRITGYRLIHLDETGVDWRYSRVNVWSAEKYLIDINHTALKSSYHKYLNIKKKYIKNGALTSGHGWL